LSSINIYRWGKNERTIHTDVGNGSGCLNGCTGGLGHDDEFAFDQRLTW